jgi:hypothetical protein
MPEKPNLNTGQPWSEIDTRDLRAALDNGDSIREAAEFLCRTVEEVEAKMRELGLPVAR